MELSYDAVIGSNRQYAPKTQAVTTLETNVIETNQNALELEEIEQTLDDDDKAESTSVHSLRITFEDYELQTAL